jgi:hypothetical protein
MQHLLGQLLDVVTGTRIIGQLKNTCKLVEAIADCHVYRLPKDVIPLIRVCDDLQQSVSRIIDHLLWSQG